MGLGSQPQVDVHTSLGEEGEAAADRVRELLDSSRFWTILNHIGTPLLVKAGACLGYMVSSATLTFLNKKLYTEHDLEPLNLFIV